MLTTTSSGSNIVATIRFNDEYNSHAKIIRYAFSYIVALDSDEPGTYDEVAQFNTLDEAYQYINKLIEQ